MTTAQASVVAPGEVEQQPLPGGVSDDPKALAAARAVLEQRAVLAEWEAKAAAAAAELQSLTERAGEAILDNPDAEDDVEAAIAQLERRVAAAEKAIEAQRPRVMVAESRYLTAEADVLEPLVVKRAAELEEHRAKTTRLLAELEAHNGPYVTQEQWARAIVEQPDTLVEGLSWKSPRETELVAEVESARRQLRTLRELAAGRDPRQTVRRPEYPRCVQGADALVSTPAFLDSVERARSTVVELEAAREAIPTDLERLDQQAMPEHGHDVAAARARLEQRLAVVDDNLAKARAHLAALTAV